MELHGVSRPVHPVTTPTPVAAAVPSTATSSCAGAAPADCFHLNGAVAPSSTLVQGVFSHRGLDKDNHNYDLRGYGFSPSGASLCVYQDPRQPSGNYLSVRSPRGDLLWERAIGDEAVGFVTVAPNGHVLAKTDRRIVCIGPDGHDVFQHEYTGSGWHPNPVVTGDSSAWWLESGKLCGLRADGTSAAVSAKLDDVLKGCDELVADAPGGCTLLARKSGNVFRVDPVSGEAEKIYSFARPALPSDPSWRGLVDGNNYAAHIQDVRPTPDGGISVVMIESISTYGTPHCSPSFFAPEETYQAPRQTLSQRRLVLVPPQGEPWTTPELGSGAVGVESSGSVLLGKTLAGRSTISRVTPAGAEEVASVSHIAYTVLPRPGSDHLLVHHAGTVDELGKDGQAQHSVSPGPDLAMFRLAGLAPDGRAILVNDKRIALADMASGQVSILTDHKVDGSWKLTAEAMEKEAAEAAQEGPRTVEVEQDWVVVDGVRVPRRPKPE